jgi:hypothetical protein
VDGQFLFLAMVIAGFSAFVLGLAGASIWTSLARD